MSIIADVLDDVIQMGGLALKAEDDFLLARRRGHHRRGGLLAVQFERYYQHIVWRSLLDKYDAQIELPREGGYLLDLIIDDNLFEMKYWREDSSAKVNSDIRRLRSFSRGGNLLVFSANPNTGTDAAIQFLVTESPAPQIGQPDSIFKFETESPMRTEPFEFWFAGWRVPPTASAVP